MLRQFAAGSENHGRAAALQGIAYTTGDEMRDERNGRRYQFDGSERVLSSALCLPKDAPESWRRENFSSLAAQQQFVWTSLAKFEERQRRQHAGRTGHGNPIISRHDVLILDKRLFIDANGKARKDGTRHAHQVASDFVRENYTRKGLVASFSIHDQENGNGNFHVHIVSSYRILTADGWGERKRPFGKAAWAVWAKQKQSSALKIQTRKLEQLGVIPKAERTTGKRETLTAWKMQCGFMTQPNFRPARNFTSNKSLALVSSGKAITSSIFRTPVIERIGTAFGKYAALMQSPAESPDNAARGTEPRHHSGGGGGGGGGGGIDGEGVDFVLTDLHAAVATAAEKLRTAMLTGIGIPAAQAALAAAKLNLKNHGKRGKGKSQGGGVRPKFRRQKSQTDQKL